MALLPPGVPTSVDYARGPAPPCAPLSPPLHIPPSEPPRFPPLSVFVMVSLGPRPGVRDHLEAPPHSFPPFSLLLLSPLPSVGKLVDRSLDTLLFKTGDSPGRTPSVVATISALDCFGFFFFSPPPPVVGGGEAGLFRTRARESRPPGGGG